MNIELYKSEIDDGLAEKITTGCSVAYACLLENAKKEEIDKAAASIHKYGISKASKDSSNPNQVDLAYFKSLYVTTGWNGNNDIFDKEEVWAGRVTPEDKPINYMHNEADIIGHITGSYPVNEKLEELTDIKSLDDVPDLFHLMTYAVLYKMWEDEDRQKRTNKVLAEIADQKWSVSMECRFKNFDYVLKNDAGECEIVPRNKTTAFLSKYLIAYGGQGKYKDKSIGRLMRGLLFTGKGIVTNPANSYSQIFSKAEKVSKIIEKSSAFLQKTENLVYSSSETEKNNMSVELEKELASLKAKNSELENQLKEQSTKEFKAKAEQVEQLQKVVTDKNSEVKTLTDQLNKSTAEFTTLSDNVKKMGDELAGLKSEKKISARAETIQKSLGLDVEQAKAFAKDLGTIDDAAFEAVIKAQVVVKAQSLPSVTGGTNPSMTEPVKTVTTANAVQPPVGTIVNVPELLDGVKFTKGKAATMGGTPDSVGNAALEKACADIAKYFSPKEKESGE